MIFLKPDIEITSKILIRGNIVLKVMCLSIIALAIYAYINDFSRFGIYLVLAIVAFLFLGDSPEIPDDSWSSGQKSSWTKKFTTLKIMNNELIYIYGNGKSDKKVFPIEEIKSIVYKGNKLLIRLKNNNIHKINAKYWNPTHINEFIETTTKYIT